VKSAHLPYKQSQYFDWIHDTILRHHFQLILKLSYLIGNRKLSNPGEQRYDHCAEIMSNRVIQNNYSPNQQLPADESLDNEKNLLQWMQ
jgi:hypothetical protein